MAQQTEVEVAPRLVTGKATSRLRKEGLIPANIFGHHQASQAIQLEVATFDRLRRSHAATNILALKLPDGSVQTVLIRHVQRDAVADKVLHVDFFRVGIEERIKVKLTLHFVGEAPALKQRGSVLLHQLEALEAECRVGDIVEHLDVDISPLVNVDDVIRAGDIKLPESYKLLNEADEIVVKVAETRASLTTGAETQAEAGSSAGGATTPGA